MYEILNNHCNKKNGLFLLDLPTGIGKTHNVKKWIFDNYKEYCKDGRKIFFLTTLKKNLPFVELRDEYFKKNGMLKDFDTG